MLPHMPRRSRPPYRIVYRYFRDQPPGYWFVPGLGFSDELRIAFTPGWRFADFLVCDLSQRIESAWFRLPDWPRPLNCEEVRAVWAHWCVERAKPGARRNLERSTPQ